MHFKLLNPSKYLGAADFEAPDWKYGKEPTLTIRHVQLESMEGELPKGSPPGTPAPKETKGMITLDESPKGWLMNVTNARCLAAMFGTETNAWIGKRVTLHVEQVLSFGEWVPGVRIHGSPDLPANVAVTIKLRKKKTQTITLVKTGTSPAVSGARPAKVEWITFGVGLKEAKRIVELSAEDLLASIALAEKNIAAIPKDAAPPKWLPATQAQLEALKAEKAMRDEVKAAEAAASPGAQTAPAADEKPPF